VTDRDYHLANATALRLLLAQVNRDDDALIIIQREIEPDILERPDRMRMVLACVLGLASASVITCHQNDRAAATKTVEQALRDALDAAHLDDD
jgi:hypothetical protein